MKQRRKGIVLKLDPRATGDAAGDAAMRRVLLGAGQPAAGGHGPGSGYYYRRNVGGPGMGRGAEPGQVHSGKIQPGVAPAVPPRPPATRAGSIDNLSRARPPSGRVDQPPNRIRTLISEGRMDVFLDLHNPGSRDPVFFYTLPPDLLKESVIGLRDRFIELAPPSGKINNTRAVTRPKKRS